MANSGDDVLAGNNEDWYTINSYIQFIPGDEGEYGQIYFGTSEWYAEGGMNSEGLFYDAAAIPAVTMNDHPEKSWPSNWPPVTMLESCANVSEAIQMFNNSRFDPSISWQLLVADGNGDAAIFAPGADGEWHYILKDSEDFLVVTNFNLAITPNYTGCVRYNTATNMLEGMGSNLTAENFATILDAVHNPTGGGVETIYSNICDLVNRNIYLFYNHDFNRVVKFNLEDELEQGTHLYKIADLFPDDVTNSTSTTTTSLTSTQPPPNHTLTITISALVGGVMIGLVVIGIISRRMQRKSYP
jgi:penicillin V acylase-like amidase (Ntn superfamily)